MTLAQFEASLPALPADQRYAAAGAAYATRQRLASGETFAVAQAGVLAQSWQLDALTAAGQLSTYRALTGP
jgi:hypothetical protein